MLRTFVSTALLALGLGQMEVRRADMLTPKNKAEYCKIHQGDNLTMLECIDSHEMYLTSKLATNWHMNPLHGSADYAVAAVGNS